MLKWQHEKNLRNKYSRKWDHALLLTGADMEKQNPSLISKVVGLAPVNGMCLPEASCSVIQGKHFESIYVIAHELGHNMGMKHDGPEAKNECDPGGYIMSPTLNGARNKWSPCSKRYLDTFLR